MSAAVWGQERMIPGMGRVLRGLLPVPSSPWASVLELLVHLPHPIFLRKQFDRINIYYCGCPVVWILDVYVHKWPGGLSVLESWHLTGTTSSGQQRAVAGATVGRGRYPEMRSNFIFLFLLLSPTILSFTWIFPSEKTELIATFFFLFCPSITRTFASGKTEKVIFQALKELGLPSGKVFINLIMCF